MGLAAMPSDSPILEACTQDVGKFLWELLSNPLALPLQDSPLLVPVRPMTLRDMEEISANVSKWYPKLTQQLPDRDIPLEELVGSNNNPKGHLAINLLARDDEIKAAFETWLRSRREHFTHESADQPLRSKALAEWANSKLIPYFDLTLWTAWTRQKITEQVITDLLFPGVETLGHVKVRSLKASFAKYMNKANAIALMSSNTDPDNA